MGNFSENLDYLYRRSSCETDDAFGLKLGLKRWTVNKLRNGARNPTGGQLDKIAQYCGVDPDDLLLDHTEFVNLSNLREIQSNYMVHALKTIELNLQRCREIFPKYAGQYIVYTNAKRNGFTIASLLNITRVTKNGIEFSMINPYREGKEYDAFKYSGYMMPIDEFLYLIGEQKENTYEILTMIFHSSGAPKSGLLQGLWTGIGVRDGAKAIASGPALAVRRKTKIEDWKSTLDIDLGYLKTTSLSEMIQRKLRSEIITIAM